jgi:hypothetical protein
MTDLSDFDAPKRPWLNLLIPSLIVFGFAGIYLLITTNKGNEGGNVQLSEHSFSEGSKLKSGQLYYIFARVIELYPKKFDGDSWDIDDSAPDVKYQIIWEGKEEFSSDTKKDQTIADWTGVSVKFSPSDLAGKTISPDKAIKAARIRYEKGGVIDLLVKDDDVADDDEAGKVKIELDGLKVGKNIRNLKQNSTNEIKLIKLRVLPHGSPIKDLVELMK